MNPADQLQLNRAVLTYRRRRRLLVAKGIHFHADRSAFEEACRSKLSKPENVKFFWPEPIKTHHKHSGMVMLGFEDRPDCHKAQEELKGLSKFFGREVHIKLASRRRRAMASLTPLPTTTAAAATTTTTAADDAAVGVTTEQEDGVGLAEAPATPAAPPSPAPATPAAECDVQTTAAVPEEPGLEFSGVGGPEEEEAADESDAPPEIQDDD